MKELKKYVKNYDFMDRINNDDINDIKNIDSEILTDDEYIKNLNLAISVYKECKYNFWAFFKICKIKSNNKTIHPVLNVNNALIFHHLINGSSIYNLHSRKAGASVAIEIYKTWIKLFYNVKITEYDDDYDKPTIIVPSYIKDLSNDYECKTLFENDIKEIIIIHQYAINKNDKIPEIITNKKRDSQIQYIIETEPVKLDHNETSLIAYRTWISTTKADIMSFDNTYKSLSIIGIEYDIFDDIKLNNMNAIIKEFKMLDNNIDNIKTEYLCKWF